MKLYKQVYTCSMCKKRFTIDGKKGGLSYSQSTYCPECREKYFPKKEEDKKDN